MDQQGSHRGHSAARAAVLAARPRHRQGGSTVLLKAGVAAVVGVAVFAGVGIAGPPSGPAVSDVPGANTKAAGYAPASKLSAQLQQIVWAQGSTPLENPDGIDTHYGYQNDVSSPDDPSKPRMVPTTISSPPSANEEAQKTEPDKNTYLGFKDGLRGADALYSYGTHFLFQGHENGVGKNPDKASYITRINLDADAEHRVTLLATKDTSGRPIATIDGSTWDPWAQRLLFTTESPD